MGDSAGCLEESDIWARIEDLTLQIEKEAKFPLPSWEYGEQLLATAGACVIEPRGFEWNCLFDRPDGALRRAGEALRLRRSRGRGWLTLKRPVEGDARVKHREEFETGIGDAEALEAILRALGLEEQFVYEKYRAVYELGEVMAFLDETPIGVYLELEGQPAAIESLASHLGLSMAAAINDSYPALYEEHRRQRPSAPKFMQFEWDHRP